MNQIELWVIVPIVVVGLAYILSRLTSKKDDAFARKALEALYAGTCSNIRDLVWQPEALDIGIETAAKRVQFEYGEPGDLKFRRANRSSLGLKEEHWYVSAEKKPFMMVLTFDDDGKLVAIAAHGLDRQPPTIRVRKG